MITIVTDYGPLPFKVSRLSGRIVTATPEFADVVRLAEAKSLPVREVLAQARAAGPAPPRRVSAERLLPVDTRGAGLTPCRGYGRGALGSLPASTRRTTRIWRAS